jgi:imidazolonepropionase-like amidohydrolase
MNKIFRDCILIDGTGTKPVPDATVIVKDDKIIKVTNKKENPRREVYGEDEIYDCKGKTILPGLVNAHEHLAYKRAGAKRRELLITSDNLYSFHAAKSALLSLYNGVTTIRDMGVRNDINLSIKQAITAQMMPGPRIVVSGTPIGITGAKSRNCRPADSPDEARKVARQTLKAGADFIKLFSSCDPVDTGGEELAIVEMRMEEMRAAIEESHRAGKKAAAHSVGIKAIKNALDAGVDSIEHGIYLNESLAEQMLRQKTVLVPTISGYREMGNLQWGWPERAAQLYGRLKESHLRSIALAVKMGVNIAVGTDSNGDIVDEMGFLLECGLTPMGVLIAATLNGASLIGIENLIGTIEPGKFADFILIDGDPLSNIQSLRNVILIVKNGTVLRREHFEFINKV